MDTMQLIWLKPMRGCQLQQETSVQSLALWATYPPPPTIPYTFLYPLGPLVGAASGTTTAEAQRPHAARIHRLRAGWCVEISASAAPEGVPSQT